MPSQFIPQLTDAEINTRDSWGGDWNELETALRGLSQTQTGGRFADEPQCEAVRQTLCELRHPHRIADTIGPYRLERLLGAGGMGTVYLARHLTLDQPAAVKVLNLDGALNSQAIRRFRKEMETAGKLVHPNIVRALHAGDEQGVPYLAMEFVEGVDLSSVLAQHGPMNVPLVAEIARQTAVALLHAHQAGIVHRDVKPSNLMLTPEGTIKLLDLGLALDRERQAAARHQLTRTGQALGTIDFVAPEQLEDPSRVDARADIYSLGATIFALLCGTAPWDHRHYASPAKQVADVLGGDRPPLKDRRESGDSRLDALVERLLHRDPRQRPESLADVIPNLEAIAGNADLRDLLNPAIDTSPAAIAARVAAEPAARERTGRPGWVAAFGVAAAALAIVAAGAIWLQNDNGTLRIRLAPGQSIQVEAAPVEPTIIAPRDQRTAAVWAIARGGRVTIGTERKPITIRTVDKLPTEDFRLRTIDLSGAKDISANELRELGQLPQLLGLVLDGTTVGDDLTQVLPNFPKLQALYLRNTQVTDASLPYLGSRQTLRGLALDGTNITNAKLASLLENGHLEKLLLNNTKVSDEAINTLAALPLLSHLEIANTSVTEAALPALRRLNKLRHLNIRDTSIPDSAIPQLRDSLPTCEIISQVDT